ncbi:MAG: hypothetical protein HYX76_12375, partial [Acidobacteria bacterium]|nr:hypothetical protein [Acidobacteriota bacterium]
MIGSLRFVLGALTAFASVLAIIVVAQTDPATEKSRAATAAPGGPVFSADERIYVGSDACAKCHETEHGAWRKALHVQMTKPVAEALVLGDFSPGMRLEKYGRAYKMTSRDGRRYVSVAHKGGAPEEHAVDYTLGARRFQGYLSKLPDGRIYVLPVFWHVESRRWLDWKEITPVPDGDHDLRQIWNVTCFNCHATNLVKNFDAATKRYETTWTEMGIGCEACHGPGRAHVALMKSWEANPASRPTYDHSAKNRQLGRLLKVFSPRSADRRQVFDACSYCHGNKNNLFVGFAPGDRYDDYALPFLISQPIPDNDPQGDYWPDGRPNRFNRPQALTLSGCFAKSDITCTSCHVGHGSKNDHALKVPMARSDLLCTQCHTQVPGPESRVPEEVPSPGSRVPNSSPPARDPGPGTRDFSAHTHHRAESIGSRCIECHMSDVNWRLLNRRRDHTFAAPVPELTARYGVPNACTTCHDNRSPEWALAVMDQWYGDGERRQAAVRVADTMYRAGANDLSALPDLARLLVDRRQGMAIRASAAEFIGRLIVRTLVVPSYLPPRSSGESQATLPGTDVRLKPGRVRLKPDTTSGVGPSGMRPSGVGPSGMR